jgi:tRNA G37 N-methylase Trm5
LYLGDVRKIVPKLKEKFNRIIMPLPKTGEEFLGVALPVVKKNGFVHLYAFLSEKEVDFEKKKILQLCKDQKYKIKIVQTVKCGQFSPRTFRYCFDLKIL